MPGHAAISRVSFALPKQKKGEAEASPSDHYYWIRKKPDQNISFSPN